jgi:cathepsin F
MKSLAVLPVFLCLVGAVVDELTEEREIIEEAQKIILRETNSPKAAFGLKKGPLATEAEFNSFTAQFNRKYGSEEERRQRFRTFRVNMFIARVLQETERGSAKYGATKFADVPVAEFKLNYRNPLWDLSRRPEVEAPIPQGPIPKAWDWRQKGAVTPVKNQAACGSCWAFSTTGNIEGQWFLQKKKLLSLSEQELVDCDKIDDGCNGGFPSDAYKEIIRLGGLETEDSYPYIAEDEKCLLNKSMEAVYINSSVAISKNEADMAAWCAARGPMSIGINAMAMQFYWGGISHPWSLFCNPILLDHGVLIVGYGVQPSKHPWLWKDEPYWIVKNSWGPDWGEQGYYRVYRGGGTCGVNQMVTSAIVK